MAEKKPFMNKATLLHGMVTTSSIGAGRIDEIQLPELDNNFILVGTRDIPGTNRVRVLDNSIPLLTSSEVSYRRQPILAIFGFDTESVQLKSREINISYELPSSEESKSALATKGESLVSEPVTHAFGDMDAATSDANLKILQKVYRFSGSNYNSHTTTRISAEWEEDKLHLYTPTQWPSHVKETVSETTMIPKKKIIIHRLPFYAPHDEMLITPSILCSIASIAALKGNCPVELTCNIESFRPSLEITRKSWYFEDGRVQAEQIIAIVNQGCAPMFTEEMANQLIAGPVPIYPL